MKNINNLNNYSVFSSSIDKGSTNSSSKDLFVSVFKVETEKSDFDKPLLNKNNIYSSDNLLKIADFRYDKNNITFKEDDENLLEKDEIDFIEEQFGQGKKSASEKRSSNQDCDENSSYSERDCNQDDMQLSIEIDDTTLYDNVDIEALDNMPIILDSHRETPVSKKVSLLINNMIDSLTRNKIEKAVNEFTNTTSTLCSCLTSIKYLSNELTSLFQNTAISEKAGSNSKNIYLIYFTFLITAKELNSLKNSNKDRFNFKEHKKKIEQRIKRRQQKDELDFLLFEEKFMNFE